MENEKKRRGWGIIELMRKGRQDYIFISPTKKKKILIIKKKKLILLNKQRLFFIPLGPPAEIEVDIMVRSMGPISEVDMVSCF